MRPLLAIASAARFTSSSVTDEPKQFQLFQPIAGVKPMVGPQTILNCCVASPSEFLACSVTTNVFDFSNSPTICPVFASSCKPSGKLSAEKVIGRSPVAAMVKRNGWPGRTPKIFALLMRGFGEDFGVKITAGSCGGEIADGSPELIVINAFAQSAWSKSILSASLFATNSICLTP